ncbi:transposase [Candidatus Roizmanbacteria bacterium]|nr:transposase [Candidatus Roizmanbacteria bacterium]
MSDKFRNIYRIPSTRLPNWNYSDNGYYFVTICTKDKKEYFGTIIDNKTNLSKIGEMAKKYWLEISIHFPFVELDEFVVMPNHVHGIVIIKNDVSHVETPKLGVSTTGKTKSNKWKSGCLGAIINQYKRICTINIRKKFPNFAWQSRFYDHIIRNEKSFYYIHQYIKDNPRNWEEDRNNSEDLWI